MNPEMEEAKGHVKQAAGDLTDNDDLKAEGKADELAGKAKGMVEDAADAVSNAAEEAVDKVKGLFNKD